MGDKCCKKEEEILDAVMVKRRMYGRGGAGGRLSCNKSDNKEDEACTALRKYLDLQRSIADVRHLDVALWSDWGMA